MSTSPKIITISGIAGAGKSVLAQGLAEHLRDASILYYDAYTGIHGKWWPAYEHGPDTKRNLDRWLRDGGDPNMYVSIPELVVDLGELKAGRSITMPKPNYNMQEVLPAKYILFEEPFGRARFEISKFVDYSIHLDLQPDIAFARTVLRQAKNGGDPLAFVEKYLQKGLSEFFKAQGEAGKACADLVVDATLTEKELIATAGREIRSHFQT